THDHLSPSFYSFSLHRSRAPRYLHSFPTRRSSDLVDQQGNLQPLVAATVPSVENSLWQVFPDGRMQTTWKLNPKVVCMRPSGKRSEEHTSELQSRFDLVCRLLLEKKKKKELNKKKE